MTIEEMLAGVADENIRNQLAKVINDQNKYIGQLEAAKNAQVQQAQQSQQVTNQPTTNSYMENYIKDKMRSDFIGRVEPKLRQIHGDKIYDALKDDLIAFVNQHMEPESASENYVMDAFGLIYARAMADSKHGIHAAKSATSATAEQTQTAQSMAQQNPLMQGGNQTPTIIQQPTPPTMNGGDKGVFNVAPNVEQTGPKDTREAKERFRQRLMGSGQQI